MATFLAKLTSLDNDALALADRIRSVKLEVETVAVIHDEEEEDDYRRSIGLLPPTPAPSPSTVHAKTFKGNHCNSCALRHGVTKQRQVACVADVKNRMKAAQSDYNRARDTLGADHPTTVTLHAKAVSLQRQHQHLCTLKH